MITVEDIMYYSPEFDEIESDYYTDSTLPAHHSLSHKYGIDQWDLDNYAYMRRNYKPLRRHSQLNNSLPYLTTPSPAGEPIPSRFYYIPAGGDDQECPGCCAGIDEQLFQNARLQQFSIDDPAYSTYTDVETSSSDQNCSSDSTLSTMRFRPPSGYSTMGTNYRRPSIMGSKTTDNIGIKPPPQIEFPAPPPYEYLDILSGSENYCSLPECTECETGVLEDNVPIYDRRGSIKRHRGHSPSLGALYPPNHFSLSKKGLLQIDYSCNWNNLNRYIAK